MASEATTQALQEGQTSIQAAEAANRIEIACKTGQPALIYDQAFVENFDGGRTFGANSWLQKGLVGASTSVPILWDTLKGAMRGSVAGGGTGALAGSLVPGAGTAVGAVSGAGFGAVLGGYLRNKDIMTGLSRLELNKFRSEDGQKLDPDVADIAAQLSGSLGAMLESIGMGPVIKTIPGAQKLISGLRTEGLKVALNNPGVRTALYNFAKNSATIAATETTTEVLQQGVSIFAGELAKSQSDGQWDFKSPEEIAAELVEAGTQALQVMTLMGPLISSTRFGADLVAINRSKRDHDKLNKIITDTEGNALFSVILLSALILSIARRVIRSFTSIPKKSSPSFKKTAWTHSVPLFPVGERNSPRL